MMKWYHTRSENFEADANQLHVPSIPALQALFPPDNDIKISLVRFTLSIYACLLKSVSPITLLATMTSYASCPPNRTVIDMGAIIATLNTPHHEHITSFSLNSGGPYTEGG